MLAFIASTTCGGASFAGELGDGIEMQAQGVGPDLDPAHAYGGELSLGIRSFQPAGDRHRRPAPGAATGYAFLFSVVTVKVPSGSSPTR